MKKVVLCPWCAHPQEINDDNYEFQQARDYEQECPKCRHIFVCNTIISQHYSTNKEED
jgi:hypothetical protein